MRSLTATLRAFLLAATLAGATGCLTSTKAPGSAAIPAGAPVSDRLSFGRSIQSGGVVSDSAWSTFLREVVTPRLPGGFAVMRSVGQWRYANGEIVQEDGFVLEVTHALGTPPDSTFAAIAAEYCRRFRQEAVLRQITPVRSWFYNATSR